MAQDYYKTLGVDKNASQDDIKKAFRKLAHEHHPDKGNGNADKFKEINEAYQTLGNEQKRKQYDQFGSTFSGSGGRSGFNYQDFNRGNPFGGFNSSNVHFDFGDMDDLGDIFGSFFGGGSRRTRTERGKDLEMELQIEFEDAVYGIEKEINVSKKVLCDSCQGSGAEPGSKVNTCSTCQGTGRITQVQQTILGAFQSQTVCPDCQGQGKTFDQKCSACHGQGTVSGSEKVKIKIPAGIENGQIIKLAGKGETTKNGISGDLYIHVKIKASSRYTRQGDDIFTKEHIKIKQAILGDKIEVENVDGPVTLKIPAGTQSHTKFKLKEKGMPILRGRGRGDHIVEVIVDIPKNVGWGQKRYLDQLDI